MFLFRLISVLPIGVSFYTYLVNIVFFMRLGLQLISLFTFSLNRSVACVFFIVTVYDCVKYSLLGSDV